MPKVRRFKGYDYTKQFHQLKEENIGKYSQQLSKRSQTNKNISQPCFPNSYSDRPTKEQNQMFEEESYEFQPSGQITNNSERESNSGSNSFMMTVEKSEDSDGVKRKDELYLEEVQDEDESMKSEKRQKRYEKYSDRSDKMEKVQVESDASMGEQQNDKQNEQEQYYEYKSYNGHQDYILEFNEKKGRNLVDLVRTNYICNNNYIRLQLTLDAKKKMMTDKIKELISTKYHQTVPSEKEEKTLTENSTGKIQSSAKELEKKEAPIKKRKKKRRTMVTAKVLSQIQVLFRQYEEQQKFKDTPFYKKKVTIKTMAQALNISQTQVKHLHDEFLIDPLFIMRLARMTSNSEKQIGVMAQQMMDIRLKFLQELISRNCVITQQEIVDEMNQCQELLCRDKNGHLIPINKRCVQFLLKKGNYSRKKVQLVPKNRNSPQSVQNRYHYCKRYLELLQIADAEIYFLDESRFNMMTVRDRGWAKKGIPATKITVNSKGKDVILLAMISINGIAYYELTDGFNAAAFTISMDKIGKMLNQKGVNPHRYIIMDNCPIHNRENLKHIEQAHQLKIVYLPPYTPMVNPIEYWFNEIKNVIRKKTYKTRKQMKDSLESALSEFRVKNMSNYYDCIKPYLQLGIKRQLFK